MTLGEPLRTKESVGHNEAAVPCGESEGLQVIGPLLMDGARGEAGAPTGKAVIEPGTSSLLGEREESADL